MPREPLSDAPSGRGEQLVRVKEVKGRRPNWWCKDHRFLVGCFYPVLLEGCLKPLGKITNNVGCRVAHENIAKWSRSNCKSPNDSRPFGIPVSRDTTIITTDGVQYHKSKSISFNINPIQTTTKYVQTTTKHPNKHFKTNLRIIVKKQVIIKQLHKALPLYIESNYA